MLNEAQNVVGSVEKSTRLLSGRPKFTPLRGSGNIMLAVFKAPFNFSYISLQNVAKCSHEKQNVGSA